MSRRFGVVVIAGTLAVLSLSAGATSPPAPRAAPDHVLFMVFDQMRPDYIDRFNLEHFKRLRASSRNYPDAYVGHMTSETVVAHLVMPTGLPPRDLPWGDDVLVDVDGTLGKPGLAYSTGKLTRAQMWQLLKKIPREQFLPARILDKFPDSKVFAVGEKDYAADFLGGPHASAIVTLLKPPKEAPCTPDGVNVPDYITSNPRFTLDCKETYGTGLKTIYKLDGSRYVPGKDPEHMGGDVWTGDVALEIMQRESWSGLFLTFGGIDKIGHMLGEQDGNGLQSVPSEYHLADVLRIADEQLGRMLDALEAHGLADRTLVVVTADHGGQKNEIYLGNNGSQSCCPFANATDTRHAALLARTPARAPHPANRVCRYSADPVAGHPFDRERTGGHARSERRLRHHRDLRASPERRDLPLRTGLLAPRCAAREVPGLGETPQRGADGDDGGPGRA